MMIHGKTAPAVALPLAAAPPEAVASAPGPAFSKVLQQSLPAGPDVSQAAAEAEPAEAGAAPDLSQEPQEPPGAASPREPGKAKVRGGEKLLPAAAPSAKSRIELPAADVSSDSNRPAVPTDDPARIDPALAQWLAALNLRPQAPPATIPSQQAAGDALGATEAPAGGRTEGSETSARPGATPMKSAREAAAKAEAAKTDPDPKRIETAFAAALAEQHPDVALAPASVKAAGADGTTLPALVSGAAFQPLPEGATQAAEPVAIALSTPVESPDFSRALGVHVSVLAQGGVQQAELRLNPAEMGPVSIHITIDGTQARVEFGADLAATRQAIEAGLPELAGALRDAGFTLAGGGVAQHSSQGRGGDGGDGDREGDGRRGGRRVAVERAAPRALRRVVSAGGVDLYA